ncbi:MAG: thioredoxin domain-containing protein [Rhodocyclaceae bacterium]|nr:thioredoxin domain-containing protein [Rhodocyclaceae bacterium]
MPDLLANRLAGETSPYLLQHAANPVAWQPWDEAALAVARRENRPILLSIGYSACHWCHVMAHESFEDAGVAALMNRLFVNIKVDREERPDLDQIYQSAHQMLTGRAGGWPLTMFLAPDGAPFFGGTYFPREPRYGLPGFADLCARIEGTYRQRGADIDRQNVSLRAALAETLPRGSGALDARPLARACATLLQSLDGEFGGFGGAPKFPHPTDLAFLLRHHARTGDAAARDAALLTLRRMAEGGIHDQLGGGFSRYSVDERWEIPHFEKMLYDNGPLLALYAEAWRLTGDVFFERVANATAAWVMREMQAPAGGYYSSLDADSEGEEGRFYVWDRATVRALLSADEWRAAGRHWGLDDAPNFENRRWHLRIAAPADPADAALIAAARAKLFSAREARVRPGRDEKILTAWNALMIAGMARAARIFDRPDWLASARCALDFVRAELWNGGRLLATCKDGHAHLDAYLDDHAFLLAALLEMMQAEYRSADLDWAVELADVLLARFEDSEHGGFFFTAHDHEALIHRPKPAFDNATPAGNGVAASALQRLGHLLGDTRYLDAARRTLGLFAPQLAQQPAGCAALLEALAEALEPPTLVLLRGPAVAVRDWQRRLAREWSGLTLALPNGLTLPPALDKPESDDVNAWVCSGVTCLAPVNDFNGLRRINLIPR